MDNCCQDKACELEALRERQATTLWLVLVVNAVMFGLEVLVGLLAGSVAVLADSSDMLGDTLVYGFSLYVINRSDRWRASAALLKGSIMAVFGFGVMAQVGYKLLNPSAPDATLMSGIGIAALIANAGCLFLLTRHRHDDINMRSTWLCSRNDIIANLGVIVAAVSVWLTHSIWPDVAISTIIMVVFLRSAFQVLREAVAELRQTARCPAGTCPADACTC